MKFGAMSVKANQPRVGVARGSRAKDGDPLAFSRKLLWLYFWLLIGEGALRKWYLPSLSAPLLIIRDPVLLLLYFQAFQRGIFPKGEMIDFFKLISIAGALLGLAQFALAGSETPLSIPVLVYGWRTNFLFIPLIFLIPKIFDEADVLKMGRWCLIVSIPMALLMAYQFGSSPDSFINRVAGLGEGRQLDSALGKIRPAGTFSFITGPVCFYSLVAAFLCLGMTNRKAFPRPLLIGAFLSTGLAITVSGSRSCLLGVVFVVLGLLAGLVLSGRLAAGTLKFLAYGAVALFILASASVFREGWEVFAARWAGAAGTEDEEGGLSGRFLEQLIGTFRIMDRIPMLGAGLGVGTNVGAVLLTGEMRFLLSEGEWGRNLLEMGPIFGMVVIGFRVALCGWMIRISLRRAKSGHLLSLLLFCAVGFDLFDGQIGQPTTLGFTVLTSGLCLAALGKDEEDSFFNAKRLSARLAAKRLGGRQIPRGSLAKPVPHRSGPRDSAGAAPSDPPARENRFDR
jgi:hypothetical protein